MKKILVQALKRKVDICKANTNKKANTFPLILHSALLFYLVTDSIQYLLKTFLKFCTNIKFQMEGMHHLSYFLQRESFQVSKLNFTMLNIFIWGNILQWAIKKLVRERLLSIYKALGASISKLQKEIHSQTSKHFCSSRCPNNTVSFYFRGSPYA